MKLLYLAYIRLPTEKAHGIQIMKTCEALTRAGVDVTLVVPTRRTGITTDPFAYYSIETQFPLIRLFTPDWVHFGRLGFSASLVWFSEQARFVKHFLDKDTILYSRDALLLLQYILLGRTFVYEAHSAPTRVSLFVAHRAQALVTISESLKRAYVARGVRAKNVFVAHDACDLDFSNVLTQLQSRENLNLPSDKKVVLYVGKVDKEKGVDTFAESSEWSQDPLLLVSVGDGELKKTLQQKYARTRFLPQTEYADLPNVLAAADVLVIPNSAQDITFSTYTSPLKLFAYLASGIPVVASDVPAIREVVDESSVWFFKPDDPKSLAESVVRALSDPEREGKVIRARAVAKSYTWDARANVIKNALIYASSTH